MLGMVASVRWGRPRTAALRQKRFRVLGDGASDRRGAFAERYFALPRLTSGLHSLINCNDLPARSGT